VYLLYSESITAAILAGGPHSARSSFVKYMRSVKRSVLRLIEVGEGGGCAFCCYQAAVEQAELSYPSAAPTSPFTLVFVASCTISAGLLCTADSWPAVVAPRHFSAAARCFKS
jgi:hypothetical protein